MEKTLAYLYSYQKTQEYQNLSMFKKLEIKDEIRELETQLGLKQKPSFSKVDCIGCGS